MCNVMTRREYVEDNLEKDLRDSITKYVQLLDSLQEYPEWQDKVYYIYIYLYIYTYIIFIYIYIYIYLYLYLFIFIFILGKN